MSIGWPRYVVFQSMSGSQGGKYLRHLTEGVPGARRSSNRHLFQSSAVEAVSPYTKFEIEVASTGNGGLIHIKSCYNNKYWRRVFSNSTAQPQMLAASADAPEEDRIKWTCTLFQPDGMGTGTIHLRHVQLNAYVAHNRSTNADCLHLSNNSTRQPFSFIDWESMIILPRHVAFKGVANDDDSYLSVTVRSRENYLSLNGTEIGSNGVAQEAFNAPNGSNRFKSIFYNRFWRFNSPRIMVDATQSNSSRETMFELVKVGEADTVAIRNLHSNLFLAKERRSVYIASDMETPVQSTFLKVEDAVLSRDIYGIEYRLSDATVYSEEPIVLTSADASNMGTEDKTLTLRLSFALETTRSLDNSISAGLGVESSFKAGIPFISEGKIEMSASANYTHSWGETITETESKTDITTATVPAGTRVHVRVLATQGTCHVPFSYTQEDVLITTGRPVRTIKHDGMYTGANFYNIHTEAREEPLELVVL